MAVDMITRDMLEKMAQSGVVDSEAVVTIEEEKKLSGRSYEQILLGKGFLDEDRLIKFLGRELACPSVNLGAIMVAQAVIDLVPSSFATQHGLVPVSVHKDTLTVAMKNPSDLNVVDNLKAITNMNVKPAVALESDIDRGLKQYYHHNLEEASQTAEAKLDNLIKIAQEIKRDEEGGGSGRSVDLLKQALQTPVIRIVNSILIEGVRRKSSDIFVEPWEAGVKIRCRVDGLLEEMPSPPKHLGRAIVSRLKVMSNLDIAERRIPQDGRFRIKLQNREIDIRVSSLPTAHGEKMCMRILDKTAQSYGLEQLGFTARELAILRENMSKPYGMILVTGPTGSGKTTTLYSVLKEIDVPEINITTVEDPVEYEVDGINQVNVRESIGLTFPAALRSILRQDPDVILIGEIRDITTMDIAIKAALTGHLVLSTLHTNDTASSISRMLNMNIEPFLITSSLLMITAQRLLRKLCHVCKQPFKPDPKLIEEFHFRDAKTVQFYKPGGCPKCRMAGYAGRSVITEIMEITPAVKELVLKKEGANLIKRTARLEGMTTLRESGLEKVLCGESSIEEVLRLTAPDDKLEK